MIKILHVCSDTNIGGAGRYLLNLYNANAAGLDLYFLLPTQSKLAAVLAAAGANVIELDIAKDASWAAKDIYKIARLLKRLRPDIVHTHANFTARVSAKLVGIGKIVYTRHYVETAASAPNKLKRWLNNFLCDAVIGVTAETKPVLMKMGIAENKIAIIESGVLPIEKYADAAATRAHFGIAPNQAVILLLSRLSSEKGIDRFVEIVAKLKESHKNIIALIAGEGPEEENIRELIRQKNLDEDTIRIIGFVENVADILNATDIILNTSTTEAKSLSLLEAMSIGIPAVVSNVGGNPSLIANAENGFVVEQADADGFVARIADLLSDADLYAAMSANAINRFNQNHHAHQMVAKTKNFYEKKENNIEEI